MATIDELRKLAKQANPEYVVHCKKDQYDVYIGRPSKWGNPFTHIPTAAKNGVTLVGSREEAIAAYELWLMEQPDLLNSLDELKGKILGCWCKPHACHGDLLHHLAENNEFRKLFMFDWDTSKLRSTLERQRMSSADLVVKETSETWHSRVTRMLNQLQNTVHQCTMCSLGRKSFLIKDKCFQQHVFSTMTPSKWMVIGQNPGFNECIDNTPFVGDAGKNFNLELEINGLNRADFYISNAVKCFTIDNTKPTVDEVKACEPILRMELAILKPNLVITLGAVAFDIMCPDQKMGDKLGEIVDSSKFGVKVYPIYHPSPRNMSVSERKQKFSSDIKNLCELIKQYNSRKG